MMMKLLHRIAGLCVFMALMFLGLALVVLAAWPGRWDLLADALADGRLWGLLAGVALICLAMIFALSGIPAKNAEKFLTFDGENGVVSLSTTAIEDYITKLNEEFPTITRMRSQVIPGKRSIDVVVNVRIKAGPDIHQVCDVLQRRIRESLTSGLGVTDIRRVEVSVREIVADNKL